MDKKEMLDLYERKLTEATEFMDKKQRTDFYMAVIKIKQAGIHNIDLIIKLAKIAVIKGKHGKRKRRS